jgi:Protein of unknown function (DUF2946)
MPAADKGERGAMRWLRSNIRGFSRLALFALAVQIALTFGHIHRSDIYGSNGATATSAALATTGESPPGPSDRSSKHSDDYCAICATMSLLGNSFVAQAPHLPVPFVSRAAEQIDRVALIFIATPRASYQSRAPPTA